MTSEMLAAAIVPALISWAAIALMLRTPWSARLADHPNQRSLHAVPTPRIGGLGILVAMLPFAFLPSARPLSVILGCALGLAVVSLVDDLRSLPISVRLAAHAAAASAWMLAIGGWASPEHGAWVGGTAAIVVIVAVVWATNVFNFMDGADGFAGGMAVVGFGTYAIAAASAGEAALALVCTAMASASTGFLVNNFPPARVFLGDAGSIPLGFLAAVLGLHGVASGAWSLAFPLLVFSPFAVDATVTLLRRIARGEPFWRAHRDHYYQRLALSGWPRRRLAFAAWALMLACAASALVLRAGAFMLQCGIIFFWVVGYTLILLAIHRSTRKMANPAQ